MQVPLSAREEWNRANSVSRLASADGIEALLRQLIEKLDINIVYEDG